MLCYVHAVLWALHDFFWQTSQIAMLWALHSFILDLVGGSGKQKCVNIIPSYITAQVLTFREYKYNTSEFETQVSILEVLGFLAS